MKQEPTVRIALVQMACSGSRESVRDRAESHVRRAAAGAAQIVCLQELFDATYFPQEVAVDRYTLAEPLPSPTTERFGRLAAELGVVLSSPFTRRRSPAFTSTRRSPSTPTAAYELGTFATALFVGGAAGGAEYLGTTVTAAGFDAAFDRGAAAGPTLGGFVGSTLGGAATGGLVPLAGAAGRSALRATSTFVVDTGVPFARTVSGSRTTGPRLVHMTEAGDAVRSSGKLGLPGDLYAGPASNAELSGWALAGRTGLSPSGNFEPIFIPEAAEAAFRRPIPVGIGTAWQRFTGQHYAPRGFIDLSTGAFTRTGINRTQALWYSTDAVITGGFIGTGYWYATQGGDE